ncbi:T9SS type A sorting domain-containing protein [Hymenobacter aquaticus]|uniref:T9SS type A sorting domain-containing protein n=1 Tax=Hymenobacter aquaticus TaxID=1867101 RepID=A0A4Z0Q8G8_9BACT|nr:T9SS type A sorting domain-containing protein [Hymenobacter aquaticus]TGE25726.1 T9SS type A sorting domain-containing protein [Hymenobacter aquaticus]
MLLPRLFIITLLAGCCSLPGQAQWQQQKAEFGVERATVQDLSIVSPTVVFATSMGVPQGAGYWNFSRTNDGGATWVRGGINATPSNVSVGYAGISAVDANNVWVGVYSQETFFSRLGGGYVFYSRNGGTSWTYQSTAAFAGPDAFLNDLHMFDLDNGVVVGDPNGGSFEVYTTTNGGQQWNRVPAASLPAPITGEYGRVGLLTAVGSSVWFGTDYGRMFYSTNRGLSWQVANTRLPEVKQLAFSDALNGLALYDDAATGTITLSRTRDGGQTWTPFTATGPVYASGLCRVPGSPGAFVSTGFTTRAPGSSVTTDYGQTWTLLDQGTPRGTVAFLDAQTGWAGGLVGGISNNFAGGIYRSTRTVTAAAGAAALSERLLVYPNPATAGVLTVRLPEEVRAEQLTLLNSTGQVVLTHALPTGAARLPIHLNTGKLPPGVYLLRAGTLTRRVVLE